MNTSVVRDSWHLCLSPVSGKRQNCQTGLSVVKESEVKQGLLIVAGFAAGIAASQALRHVRVFIELDRQSQPFTVVVRRSRPTPVLREEQPAAESRMEVTMAREDRIRKLMKDNTRETLGAILASYRNETALDAVQYGKLDEEYLAAKVAEAEDNDQRGRTVAQIVEALRGERDSETPVVEDEGSSWIRHIDPETRREIGRKSLPRVRAEPVVQTPPPQGTVVDESGSSLKHPFGIGREGFPIKFGRKRSS